MNWNDSTAIKKVLPRINILINVFIAIYIIQKVGYCSEFATFLINIWNQFLVIVIGIGLTVFSYLIITLIFDFQKKFSEYTSSIVIVFISIIYFNICMSIIKPVSYDKVEIAERQLKNLNSLIKRCDIILSKSENILKDHKIRLEDSTAIINYFSTFLDSPFYSYSDSMKIEYSSKFDYFFNRILIYRPYGKVEPILDSIETNKYRQIIKNKLSIDLFLYSPNKEKMFIVVTYEVGTEPTEANALALIGERIDNKMILYRYGNFRNDYGVVNQKYALYQIITDLEDKDFGRDGSTISPLNKSFWDGWWYEKVMLNNTEKYRYQINDYAYKWNEEKKINERVTAEIQTFIEIKKIKLNE